MLALLNIFLIQSCSEMKKILTFLFVLITCFTGACGAVRTATSANRGKNTSVVSSQQSRSISNRSATRKSVSARTNGSVSVLQTRSAKKTVATRTPTTTRSTKLQRNTPTVSRQSTVVRAATQTGNANTSSTRTGVEYEQCKTAFFTCMDQFCQLKNDNFRRCSCNDRVFKYQEISDTYQDASERLTEFTENLDVVGMTREQATAMKTATEGEDALTEDKSASKQLLQAIMNAIKGEDSSVGGKYKNLNSIEISPDMSNAFGMNDYGQIIAAYNGTNLYKAVYPQCRNAVKDDCNNASLQRAVNAYLMAIEQDCNTVEAALSTKRKALRSSTYESSAMLDLARVENRQNHNTDDLSTCLTNIEQAIQSEEVCGKSYHKCLDYGQFIDVTTGAPLTGVKNFYELGNLLTFNVNENIQNQKLSSLSNNKTFVKFFENKTKKFAKDALDKCVEEADFVWQQYLDHALLDIYYAQQSKIKTVKNSCFDLVAACYDNQKSAIDIALTNITGTYKDALQPATVNLTKQLCDDYIASCNNMFAEDVIQEYMAKKTVSDSEKACRTIVQTCFDSFGGPGYENFYAWQNGTIERGKAIDWFTLYDKTKNDNIVSPCAEQLSKTEGCNTPEILENVFGGFDKYEDANKTVYTYSDNPDNISVDRVLRPSGVAGEVYNQIIDNLSKECDKLNGGFIEHRLLNVYGYQQDSCQLDFDTFSVSSYYHGFDDVGGKWLFNLYQIQQNEDICPYLYASEVDILSWGICSCWHKNFYRSKNGKSAVCRPLLPIPDDKVDDDSDDEPICTNDMIPEVNNLDPGSREQTYNKNKWCQQAVVSSDKHILCSSTETASYGDTQQCKQKANDAAVKKPEWFFRTTQNMNGN